MTSAAKPRTAGPVHIVGVGLIGASIGLALTKLGVPVTLADASPSALALAYDYGAGVPRHANSEEPRLVIVATPPDVVADAIETALLTFPKAVVTDVASVKLQPLQQLRARGINLTRYVGSHPMAGRERGGAIMARADIFLARPWVVCSDEETPQNALQTVEGLALDLGALLTHLKPDEHDESVALVSHLPQLAASLVASRLVDAKNFEISLAGTGLRDTTRIAASDPELWLQILEANSGPILQLLDALQEDFTVLRAALADTSVNGARSTIARLLAQGVTGVSRIPGKHGASERFTKITVFIDDRAGQLGRLFTELGELGINIEDLRLEHSPGAQIGFAEIAVRQDVAVQARQGLSARGWRTL